MRSWIRNGLAVAAFGLALPVGGAMAQVAKEGGSSLDALANADERLRLSPDVASFQTLQHDLTPSVREGWTRFTLGAPGPWNAYFDRRNGLLEAAEGTGIPWFAGAGNQLAETTDLAAVEGRAREFLAANEALFGLEGSTLVLNPGRSGQVSDHLWLADFDVYRGKLPITGARIVLRIGHGNLVQLGAEGLPAPATPTPEPAISRDQALEVLAGYAGGPTQADTFVDPGSLHLLPWEPPANNVPARGLVAVWEFVFRRSGVAGTWRSRVDASSGELLELRDVNAYAQAVGGVRLDASTADAVRPVPFADVAAGVYSNSAGRYDGEGGAGSSLLGQHVQIFDACGDILLESDPAGNLDFGISGLHANPCRTPGVGGPGNTRSARTQFYFVNRAMEAGRAWLPRNTWLRGTVDVNTNIPPPAGMGGLACNAAWDGRSLNFYRASILGCASTPGEIPAISLHEYGHGLDANDGTSSVTVDPGTGETYGDFTAALVTHNSCIGSGFRRTTCNGYGNPCSSCTGVRDIDWTRHADYTPSTVASFTASRCPAPTTPGYVGPCGREGHCESQVSSEALWDFAARDLPAAGVEPRAAWAVAERLWYASRSTATRAFHCNTSGPVWTSNGCGIGSLWRVLRVADDDDGDLANGTPHGAALFAAFDRHGIACPGDLAASTSFSRCTPPRAPDLGLVTPPGRNLLGWSDAGSGVVYDVFRSETGCDSGFVRIANDVAGTLHEDPDVAAGFGYSYQVVAHRAGNEACASPPSNCRTGARWTGADPWSQDTPRDTGLEPDPATRDDAMWESQDIWVRNDETPGEHQAPIAHRVNHVHVRVRNRGSVRAYNVPVEVYTSLASTGLSWPESWTRIGSGSIAVLEPGAEAEVVVPWTPFAVSHYCLLARITPPYDPLVGEGADVDTNTRNRNNIVWRNLNTLRPPGGSGLQVDFYFRNPYIAPGAFRLIFRGLQGQAGGFLERGAVTVHLGPALAERWRKHGQQGKGFRQKDAETLELTDPEAYLVIPLDGKEEHKVGLTVVDLAAAPAPENGGGNGLATYVYRVVQEEAGQGVVIGGVTYRIEVPPQ